MEVADRYRITITGQIRKAVTLRVGQKVAVIPFGDKILVQPLPVKPEERIEELVGDFTFNRAARRKAYQLLVFKSKKKFLIESRILMHYGCKRWQLFRSAEF